MASLRSHDASAIEELEKNHYARPWTLCLQHMALNDVTSRMSEYYGNVAILAGLLAIFAGTELSDPPESLSASATAFGVFGTLSFVLLMGSVVECILMSNVLKQISSEPQFIEFLQLQKNRLQLATHAFICGSVFLIMQICMMISVTYDASVTTVAALAMLSLFSACMLRYASVGKPLQNKSRVDRRWFELQ